MAFVDYEFYEGLYGTDAIEQTTFNRMVWNAEKIVKDMTTGIDGRCKLIIAFPTVEADAEAVKRCICEVVRTMSEVTKAEAKASEGGVIESVKAGNESISYAVNAGIASSVYNKKAQDSLYGGIVKSFLSCVRDNNGVNLLYRGVYPYI